MHSILNNGFLSYTKIRISLKTKAWHYGTWRAMCGQIPNTEQVFALTALINSVWYVQIIYTHLTQPENFPGRISRNIWVEKYATLNLNVSPANSVFGTSRSSELFWGSFILEFLTLTNGYFVSANGTCSPSCEQLQLLNIN